MRYLCTEEYIQAFDTYGVAVSTRVFRYREFAAGRDELGWAIFFVPMGCTLSGFVFATVDEAIECMIEVDKLRNNWLGMDEADWEAVRQPILDIHSRYGRVYDEKAPDEKGVEVYPENFNGY